MSSLANAAIVSQILSFALKPIMPKGYISLPCEGCQSAVSVREGSEAPVFCSTCRRAGAESVAAEAVSDVADLIRGRGLFATFGCEDRREMLRPLGEALGRDIDPDRNDCDAPNAQERDEIESRIEAEEYEPVPDFDEGYSGGTF